MRTSSRTATTPKRGLVQEGEVDFILICRHIGSLSFLNSFLQIELLHCFDFSPQRVAGS